jgi:hypothetical protein
LRKYLTLLKGQFGLPPKRGDERRSALHGFQAITGEAAELVKIGRAEVGKLMLLQITPNVLSGVELGRVARQRFNLNGAVEPVKIAAHQAAAMGRQSVPDDEQLTLDLSFEGAQKLDDLRAFDRAGKQTEVEAVKGNPSDRRQLVPVEAVL